MFHDMYGSGFIRICHNGFLQVISLKQSIIILYSEFGAVHIARRERGVDLWLKVVEKTLCHFKRSYSCHNVGA